MHGNGKLLSSFVAVLAATAYLVSAAPGSDADFDDVFYDQRQNGSENFRIHLNDVMVVVAPAEALLSVAAGSDLIGASSGGAGGLTVPGDEPDKLPKECKPGGKGKCNKQSNLAGLGTGASNKRSRLRLSNLLMPFINRAHH